jgi:hypothetical protein
VACLGTLVLSACGAPRPSVPDPVEKDTPGPVEVDGHRLTGRAERRCSALIAAVPTRVDGARRREVVPAGAHAAAWGDPAIVLRCGVAMPEEFDEFATCHQTNAVDWFIPDEQITGEPVAITMATVGRNVNVEVSLPVEHFPPANAMVDLAPAIKKSTTAVDPCG